MFQVINRQGRPFNVRVVKLGDRYGLNDCKVHGEGDRADQHKRLGPLVEFYDASVDMDKFGPRGYFISRYYAKTLREGERMEGLLLDGGSPEETIDDIAMLMVHRYIDNELK